MWIRTDLASGSVWSHVASTKCVVCTRERVWELRARTSSPSHVALYSVLVKQKAPWGGKKASEGFQAWVIPREEKTVPVPPWRTYYPPHQESIVRQSRGQLLWNSHSLSPRPLWLLLEPGLGAGQLGHDVGVDLRDLLLQYSPNLPRHLPFPVSEMRWFFLDDIPIWLAGQAVGGPVRQGENRLGYGLLGYRPGESL